MEPPCHVTTALRPNVKLLGLVMMMTILIHQVDEPRTYGMAGQFVGNGSEGQTIHKCDVLCMGCITWLTGWVGESPK